MKYRASCRSKCFWVIIIFFSFVSPINGQDSAFYMWDDLVQSPQMNEVDLVQLAQQANIELQLFEHLVDHCQQFQPEPEEAAEKLKNHIFEIGKNVREYLSRYTEEEIEALGVRKNDMARKNIESQIEEMPKVFREMEENFQKNICSEVRTDILGMAPAVKVERFK